MIAGHTPMLYQHLKELHNCCQVTDKLMVPSPVVSRAKKVSYQGRSLSPGSVVKLELLLSYRKPYTWWDYPHTSASICKHK